MGYRILVCDDEADIVRAISLFLQSEGYEVLTAANGKEALDIMEKTEVHLLLLDVMMPIMDGVTALAKIRTFSNIPVIMLTAKSEDADIVLGLNLGADDYVTKPFSPVELMARVRSQIRRYLSLGGTVKEDDLVCGGIRLNDRAKEVTVDGTPCRLTKTEYDILKLLMQEPGRVFTPSEIYESVWQEACLGTESTVAVHVRHLREKIEITPSDPRYIKMVWGRGYYMNGGKQ